MRSLLVNALIPLYTAALLSAEPVVSEFVASNQSGLADESGNRPDWIEIRNPDAAPVSLLDWSLTDDAGNLRKWVFPAVTLPAGGHLVVFASGDNRRVPGLNLHTNFSLSEGGEFLALVRPDGTVATGWSPAYPKQYPNFSYGTAVNSSEVTLVQQNTAVRAFVPANTSLIPQWRLLAFDDSAWTAGTFGVGYMNSGASPNLSADLGVNFGTGSPTPMSNGRHSYSRAAFTVADRSLVAGLRLRMKYDDGFAAWINGVPAAASPGVSLTDPISPTATVSSHAPEEYEAFAIAPAAAAALVNGTNILAIEGFNASTSSSDAIILPELFATVIAPIPGQTGYFPVPTPGALNGGDSTIQLPASVTLSRQSGTFTAAFQLTLGGAGAGQQIRYVIADPSSSGASAAEPAAASALYTGPIAISSSKFIRAAVFEGAQKGPTLSAHYMLLEPGASNNTTNFNSNLPVLVLDNHGAGQPVDSDTGAWTPGLLHLYEPVNGTARLADGDGAVPSVSLRCGLRVRGSSSSLAPKKSYAVELWNEQNLDLDQPLLGLPADSGWILIGPYNFDDTYIHNPFMNELSRRIGRWAARTRPVEVFMNQNGGRLDYQDYAGIYILMEKVKSNAGRLDITDIEPGDSAGTALTGGYIFKIDRPDSGEYAWSINNSQFGRGILPNAESGQSLVLVEPDPDDDTAAQQDYIRNAAVLPWNNTLFTERAAGFTTRNYRQHIDVASFVDHHLLNTLAYNVDALRLSAFFHKDRGGAIKAGPIWDADRALGSDDGRDANPESWSNIGYFFDRDWWYGLFRDSQFVQEMVDRWWELRQPGQVFETSALHALADAMGAEIGNTAAARDAARWSGNAPAGGVYLNEIAAMKTWLQRRGSFLDSQLPPPPVASAASGALAAGTVISLTGGGNIRYTLDGSDPRPFGGATPGSGALYSGPLTINATTVLTARSQGSYTPFPNGAAQISWSAPLRRVWLMDEVFAEPADIGISEINYNPLGPSAAELAAAPGVTASDFEWIELRNPGTRRVNTFEMKLAAGSAFRDDVVLLPVSLPPGGFALIVKNRAAFQARYGSGFNAIIAAEWGAGNLSNDGERLRLLCRDGSEAAGFRYRDDDGWPGRPDGRGATLEFTGASCDTSGYEDEANWRPSSELHGSPGSNGTGPDGRVVINEVLSHSNAPRVDAIELRNNSSAPVDAGGWLLSDAGGAESLADYQKFVIPPGTVIPPGGYVVFTEQQFNPNGEWNAAATAPGAGEFAFDGQRGDDAWLLSVTGGAVRFVDHVEFGAAAPDESWGRYPNGTGPLAPMRRRTLLDEASLLDPQPGLGADNSGVRTGPVMIQEIHHAPPGGDEDLQFVELFNTGPAAVELAGWRLRGAVDYDFTGGTLASGGVLVLVPFSPADTVKAAAFRSTYDIGEDVNLTGPWESGDELDQHDRVTLYRAGMPPVEEPSLIPLLLEGEVNYEGQGDGWPDTTGGSSLNCATPDFGSVAAHWYAAFPSPGRAPLRYRYWQALQFSDSGASSLDSADPDGDGLSNLMEYCLGLSPFTANPASALPGAVVQLEPGGGRMLVFTWSRPADRPGVVYTAQQSANLQHWTALNEEDAGSTAKVITRRAAIPILPGISRFVRLRVTVDP